MTSEIEAFDGEPRDGGHGSSILLDAPYVYVDGCVRGGDGGDGGTSVGGDGGSIRVEGWYLTRRKTPSAGGGKHGIVGATGGKYGGAGGSAIANLDDATREHALSLRQELDRVLEARP